MFKKRRKKKEFPPVLRRLRTSMSKMELARNFYWCDELDFYKMRTPIQHVLAFVNYTYGPQDVLEDVMFYFQRLQRAQTHGRRYILGRMSCALAIEDPDDLLDFEGVPEFQETALDDD